MIVRPELYIFSLISVASFWSTLYIWGLLFSMSELESLNLLNCFMYIWGWLLVHHCVTSFSCQDGVKNRRTITLCFIFWVVSIMVWSQDRRTRGRRCPTNTKRLWRYCFYVSTATLMYSCTYNVYMYKILYLQYVVHECGLILKYCVHRDDQMLKYNFN